MRYQGRLSDWNDDKGFGFVIPNGGGERAFVHTKAFERRPQRPGNGLLISYETGKDPHGRLNAAAVRVVIPGKSARPAPAATSNLRLPHITLGMFALLAATALWLSRQIPDWMMWLVAGMSLLLLRFYWHDKRAAQRGRRRTPENTLHLIALLGGWPGALVAQGLFRHKTSKRSFQIVFWIPLILNVAAIAWLKMTFDLHD